MRVLVTGGAGFIGSHLTDALIREGHRVRVLDSLEDQVHEGRKPDYLNAAAEYLWGDVRDRASLRKALKDVEVVFHEAAAVGVGQSMYQIEKYASANVLGTAVLLDTIVNDRLPIKKLLVASSMSIYGEGQYRCASCGPVYPALRSDEQLKERRWEMACPRCRRPAAPEPTPEDKPLMPTSVYAVSKRDQEELCLAVGWSYRIPTVALRYFNVYGTRQALSNPYTGVCAIFSARIKNGHPPMIFEDGRQSRDFVHVSDIVQANLLAMSRSEADYQVFNVGTGRPTSILQIAEALGRLYGAKAAPALTQKFRAGDIRHCVADISRMQRALGFAPQGTLEEGLRELVEWGRRQTAEDRVEAAAKELEAYGLAQG
ncbi:MAG: NAD-dependent epimerase/dehydratase family protein [Candidatus Omnitrophica bacterium]|nr:NAD-dependent epimerase/dehydratase family protein [Candidatus Omnitrophota bacterium]